MAQLPTSDENARKVLQIFAHFGTRAGESILKQNILVVMANQNWRADDINDGLKWGVENGWFETGKKQFHYVDRTRICGDVTEFGKLAFFM